MCELKIRMPIVGRHEILGESLDPSKFLGLPFLDTNHKQIGKVVDAELVEPDLTSVDLTVEVDDYDYAIRDFITSKLARISIGASIIKEGERS